MRLSMMPLLILFFLSPRYGASQVRYTKSVEIQATGVEIIRVVNRLGSLKLNGWDRPFVRVTAIKKAANTLLGERLRVEVSRRNLGDINVKTYLQMMHQDPQMLQALRQSIQKNQAILARQIKTPIAVLRYRRDLERFLHQLEQDLESIKKGANKNPTKGSRISVPVSQGRVDLHLWVPRKIQIKAKTFKHDISVIGVRGGIDAVSEEGAVEVSGSKGRVVTRTQKGEQKVVKVEGPVTIEGGEADVIVRKITGPVEVVLISGSIEAEDLSGPRVVLRTVMGNIQLGGRWSKEARIKLISRVGNLRVLLDRKTSFQLQGQAIRWWLGGIKIRFLKRQGNLLTGCVGNCSSNLRLFTRKGTVDFVSTSR